MTPLFSNTPIDGKKTAIISDGVSYSYDELLNASQRAASAILYGRADLEQATVAFMVKPGFDYVRTLWGIWLAGGVAVPLATANTASSVEYYLKDSQPDTVIADDESLAILAPNTETMSLRLLKTDKLDDQSVGKLPTIAPERNALILYTSGTTSHPKGVVSMHGTIQAQVTPLVGAWKWTSADHILCVLPLHHIHGVLNIICCSLSAGATCEILPRFSAEKVYEIFSRGGVNVFMAVPTIYYKLIAAYEALPPMEQKRLSGILAKFRLMVSGSAALPVSTLEKWQKISGHILLERYGMTEIGMAISNPYEGARRAGYIGTPLPGIKVRLVDENRRPVSEGQLGEIQIKGPNVFKEYWRKPDATKKSFTNDGWFMTGDVAIIENGMYRIVGRDSVDIIKSGGYKLSALEIEEVLRSHQSVADCAVVGLPDDEWGEVVAAAVVAGTQASEKELNAYMREKLPAYKVPRQYLFLPELPRNAMGKVVKTELKSIFSRE